MPIKLIISLYDIIHAHNLSKEVNRKEDVIVDTEEPQPIKEEKDEKTDKKSESEIDKIKKLKSLLDEGILTQEEFDNKKKEILAKI